MTVLTPAAVLLMAAQCQSLVAPTLILKIATHESGLNTTAVHVNADRSRDLGLMQINEKNLSWLGLTEQAALDPCISIAAGAQVLAGLSRYNTGSATKGIGYATAVLASMPITPAGANAPASPATPVSIFARPTANRELVFNGYERN
jgi:type IV secretion system protein VirB1